MAPLVRRLARQSGIEARVCVTAQHREMLDQVLELFEIEAHHDLAVMAPGQDLSDVTSRVLLGMRDVLAAEAPDLVLVHGDTTTCMAAGLAAFYAGVPVGHVEAGLRSGDLTRPFPEELNRVLMDSFAELCFPPTELAATALQGAPASVVEVTGNTVIDALLDVRASVAGRTPGDWREVLGDALVTALDGEVPGRRVVLVTGHRRESFGRGFEDLCSALCATAEAHPAWTFVYPVHRNPNVQGPVRAKLGGLANVHLIDPLEYAPFVWLMDRADLILTDSGGIQEEAPSLGVPVLVTREVTERPEAVAAGTVRLVGTDPERIRSGIEEILGDEQLRAAMGRAHNPYGDGRASERIVRAVLAWGAARAEAHDAA